MTERDLLAVVAASLASSSAWKARVGEAQRPDDWRLIVEDAADLLQAVDDHLGSRNRKRWEQAT